MDLFEVIQPALHILVMSVVYIQYLSHFLFQSNLNEKNHLKKVIYTTTDTLVWQMLASVIIPGFTINRVCALSNLLLKKSEKLPKNTRRWVVTGIGLATIPFIIKPIDDLVDYVLDESIRKLQPK